MKNISLSFFGRSTRVFPTYGSLVLYLIDVFIRSSIILLIGLLGISHLFFETASPKFSQYLFLYIIAILIWGFLFIKYIVKGKGVFGQTQFDIYFMGILTFFLLAVFLSGEKISGIFGSYYTWSYSIFTMLAVSIIYYIVVLTFNYRKGMKWIFSGYLLLSIVTGIYYVLSILETNKINEAYSWGYIFLSIFIGVCLLSFFNKFKHQLIAFIVGIVASYLFFKSDLIEVSKTGFSSLDFVNFLTMSIPLTISAFFVFRKNRLRAVSLFVFVNNLILISYYSRYLKGTLFVLAISVLALLLLFYLSFWIKNSVDIVKFIQFAIGKLFNPGNLVKQIKKSKQRSRQFSATFYAGIMALATIFLIIIINDQFHDSILRYWPENIKESIAGISSLRNWLLGSNNLNLESSPLEAFNVLKNYGIFSFVVFILIFVKCISISGKLTVKALEIASFRNIIFLSSLFLEAFILLTYFLLFRFNPFTYILLLLLLSLLSIIDNVVSKRLSGKTIDLEPEDIHLNAKKIIFSIITFLITIAGVVGIFYALKLGFFGEDLAIW